MGSSALHFAPERHGTQDTNEAGLQYMTASHEPCAQEPYTPCPGLKQDILCAVTGVLPIQP